MIFARMRFALDGLGGAGGSSKAVAEPPHSKSSGWREIAVG
jgi:hypothetical protein